MKKAMFFFVFLLLMIGNTHADIKLPHLFSDNMVLQRGVDVIVWGWAEEGEKITLQFQGKKLRTEAKNRSWAIPVGKLKQGGPYEMVLAGNNRITLKNILIGEVWICSGQSNMEWPMSLTLESEKSIASAQHPNLRLFKVEKMKSDQPISDVLGSWTDCNPDTVKPFSAVAYYFGRDLQKALKVPVGLIQTAWGGSPAEVWMSREVLENNPDYRKEILDAYPAAWKRYQDNLANWEREAKETGKTPRRQPPAPWKPSELYNGMIKPLMPYAIQGAIWYQGEANAPRAFRYRSLLQDLVRNWRKDWGIGDFSFLQVQLAPFDKSKKRSWEEIAGTPEGSDWAELREAQALAVKSLPKVGMVVITDVGEKDDIHPRKKEPVGGRLALMARSVAYGHKIVSSGPLFKRMMVQSGRASLEFDSIGKGLEARGGKLTGFSIAGSDQKFVWADAVIKGNRVEVSSPLVSVPVAVRYGWADCPVVNLWNKDGLPSSPFRTDDFPMTTEPRP